MHRDAKGVIAPCSAPSIPMVELGPGRWRRGAGASETRPTLRRFPTDWRGVGVLLGMLTFAAGCQTNAPRVSADLILPASVEPFDVEDDQTFYMADLILQPMPAYPKVDRRLGTVTTCVELVVDPQGEVAAARLLVQGDSCPALPDRNEAFLSAAVRAARNWKFIPAALCDPPPGAASGTDCETAGGAMRSVAVTLGFRFVFEAGGKVRVRTI